MSYLALRNVVNIVASYPYCRFVEAVDFLLAFLAISTSALARATQNTSLDRETKGSGIARGGPGQARRFQFLPKMNKNKLFIRLKLSITKNTT